MYGVFLTQAEFVARSRSVHGDRYDYTKAVYTYGKNKVTVTCKVHGDFNQYARDHMTGHGCRRCFNDSRREWTDQQDDYLRGHYSKAMRKNCAAILNKSQAAVYHRAQLLGLVTPRRHWPYTILPINRWDALLARVRKKEFEIDIDPSYIESLYTAQRGRCALTGWKIVFSPSQRRNTASIDRIDSDKGYLRGNIQIVHKTVNRTKLDNTEQTFYNICKAVTAYRKADFDVVQPLRQWVKWDEWQDREVLYSEGNLKNFDPEALFAV